LIIFFCFFFQSKLQTSIETSSECAEKDFESLFGKERYGRVRCYGRTMTPTTFKKKQEMDAVNRKHEVKIDGMTKRMEGLEAMIRFMLKQQHPDFDHNDIDELMAQAVGNENSAPAPRSSAATHVPEDDEVNI